MKLARLSKWRHTKLIGTTVNRLTVTDDRLRMVDIRTTFQKCYTRLQRYFGRSIHEVCCLCDSQTPFINHFLVLRAFVLNVRSVVFLCQSQNRSFFLCVPAIFDVLTSWSAVVFECLVHSLANPYLWNNSKRSLKFANFCLDSSNLPKDARLLWSFLLRYRGMDSTNGMEMTNRDNVIP